MTDQDTNLLPEAIFLMKIRQILANPRRKFDISNIPLCDYRTLITLSHWYLLVPTQFSGFSSSL